MTKSTEFRDEALQNILNEMYKTNRFISIVLASDRHALPIAEVSGEYDADALSVLVAFIKDTIEKRTVELNLGHIHRVAIENEDKMILACQFIEAGEEDIILAALVHPRTAYLRAMGRATTAIKKVWKVKRRTT